MNLEDGHAFLDLTLEICDKPQVKGPLQEWMKEAKQELGKHIEAQTSPDGTPYVPLKPKTVKRKGHSTALFETGALIASVVGSGSGHIEEATDSTARLGTGHEKNGKPIALFMQEGTRKRGKQVIPPRPFIAATDTMADHAADLIADGLINTIDMI